MPEIIIKNCNSIDIATVNIEVGKLNIKYGSNGTGKSTISRAIKNHSSADLGELLPFKFKEENVDNILPTVVGATQFQNIMMFNEEYIESFVYKQDELVENSFEIFVKDSSYDQNLLEIESLFLNVKIVFNQNNNLSDIIEDLDKLSNAFSSNSAGVAKNSKIIKAFGAGNKIENIPIGLEEYTDYLRSDKTALWIKWQTSGCNFLDISDNCPYCTSPTASKIETIQKVAEVYNDKSIEHLVNIIEVMNSLKIYFIDEAQATILEITTNSTGISEQEEEFLKRIKEQIDLLKNQLLKLQNITFFTFNNVSDMVVRINSLKINLSLVSELNSLSSQNIISPLNSSLDELLTKARALNGKIIRHKRQIGSKIEVYKNEINNFLKFAGYKYSIEIEEVDEEYKMKLKHINLSLSVEKGNQHLSYGEKNAFALILFMYDCISKDADLVILDDPISSFDKSKKFAIIEKLFTGRKSLKGKTVLMLTHDIDPIIDILKILPLKFQPLPVASFLKSKNGVITEIAIVKDDLMTFSQVCKKNIESNPFFIIKLIYLRRYYEVLDDKGIEYQLLASLLHGRTIPIKYTQVGAVEMTEDEISQASQSIKNEILTFNYNTFLNIINDVPLLKTIYSQSANNYEKLQLFRMICNERHPSNVIQKYINETYHIENEYISQLDPSKYDMVHEFIIDECNNFINN